MDLEEFIDAGISWMQADLPQRIVDLNAEKAADGREIELLIPDVENYSTGGDPILRYPWIEIAAPDFYMDDFSVGQVSGNFQPSLVVRGWVMEPRPPIDRADRHIKRFGHVLVQSLLQPSAFGAHETVERLRGAYRINPEFDAQEGPIAAVTFVFTLSSQYVAP